MKKDGAEPLGELVQLAVNPLRLPLVGQPLRLSPIADLDKGIVPQLIVNFALSQLSRQPVMSVEVDLQTARQPGGNTDVGQSQFFVDEVEIIMQALAVVGLQV